jgi:nucleotide-binding universal stress UspA family protein
MRDVRRVLVAIDLHSDGATLTAGSCFATDHAVELAKHLGAEVVLLHAAGCKSAGARNAAGRALEQVADRFRAIGVAATVALCDQPPALAILDRVQRDRIDLVFAGRRNERSQQPTPFGSVSSQLVRKCPCPVWIAKPGGDLAPRRVLAASDLSPVSERVIEYAAFVAGHYDAELHVVHAFQLRAVAELQGRLGLDRFVQIEREQLERRLAAQVARASGPSATAIHAINGSPARAVLDLNERLTPDLVVMGTRSHNRLRTRLLGNTALRLLGHLDCSLLAVKPQGFVSPSSGSS